MTHLILSKEMMTYLILKVRNTLSWLDLLANWQFSRGKNIQATDSTMLDVSKKPGNLGRQDKSTDLT